jgi:D-aminoacyl-tRNA deacylase
MKLLIQRVTHASVTVSAKEVAAIGPGALVFIGITHGDTAKEAAWLANKLIHLRMFEDDEGKINCSLLEQKKEILVVSQFTLYADCSSGRRPSFTLAASPELAEPLYEKFVADLRHLGVPAKMGVFGAEMKVSLVNDGPVTLILERNHAL